MGPPHNMPWTECCNMVLDPDVTIVTHEINTYEDRQAYRLKESSKKKENGTNTDAYPRAGVAV